MLYDKIPNNLRTSNIVPPLLSGKDSHVVDGIIGSTNMQTTSEPYGIAPPPSAKNPQSHTPAASTSEINVISSNKGKYQQQLGRKKKEKGKKKKYPSPEDKKTNHSSDEKWKPRYPCLIFI